ncbi:ABC transporter permease [Mycetocola miduiensis]|uniref:Monosaccharide ABC transporter membrane protein, CUT2 family n=1 Tax=Mycetocola miduiensis TaxID=995034 RepID=A0A1I5C5E2_9MICO|nr:ABC transporter permease [Mycetocola miduiensis]SFN82198.1 monosaccharide ABC transporter membrane protein, CUT2 family [Mycetocola miduiensis]
MSPDTKVRNGASGASALLPRVNDQLESWTQRLVRGSGAHRGAGRMVVALLIAFALFTALNPRVFLSPINLQNIAVAAPEIGIISIAMMLVMLTGGIDLSLVAIANFSAITISMLHNTIAASDPALANSLGIVIVLAGIVVGMLGGAVNGFLVSVVGITPILATLATMQIYNGMAIVWTGGTTLYGAPQLLATIGQTAVANAPLLFIIFLAVAVLIAILVNRTALGRMIQLEGANPVAARYSAIPRRAVLMKTYTYGGMLAGLAGVLFLARNPTASADYGASYVLLVIVIAVLGGTNPTGGFASVTGVVLATLTLQVVSSGFTAIRLSSYEYAIAQGVILIAVMILDAVSSTRARRQKKVASAPRSDVPTPETALPRA